MHSADHPEAASLTPEAVRRIDQACDQFEAAWQAGERPRIEEYLGNAAGPERSALLRQLLLLEWDYRRQAGEHPTPADYLPRFPEQATLIRDVCTSALSSNSDSPARGTTTALESFPARARLGVQS